MATFTKLREEEGFFSVTTIESDNSINIKEYHNPFSQIIEQYPIVSDIELRMLETLLNVSVERTNINGPHGQKQTQDSILIVD